MQPHRARNTSISIAATVMIALAGCADGSGHSRPPSRSSTSRHPLAEVAHPSIKPAAGPPVAKFTAGEIARSTGTETVALTFDDGPSDQTMAILDLLRTYGVKATFCVIGEQVQEHPELVQAIVRDGHTLCNHTWNHDEGLGQRSPDEIRADLQRTNDAIHQAVPGVPIRYFRHPGGAWTSSAVSVAQEMGMVALDWDTDPSDWDTGDYAVGPTMINHIIETVEQTVQPGSIVLSHDGGGDRTSTVTAYQTLLPYLLQQRHLRLVPLPTTGGTLEPAAQASSAPNS